MFEKEAEEYTLKRLVGLEDFDSYQSAYDRFENGVQDAFKEGAEYGYNKANEWHYMEDGDLPKENDVYLIYTTKGVLLGHYEQGGADGETEFTGEPYSDFTEYPSEMLLTEDEVIAWKEIVLPKESE